MSLAFLSSENFAVTSGMGDEAYRLMKDRWESLLTSGRYVIPKRWRDASGAIKAWTYWFLEKKYGPFRYCVRSWKPEVWCMVHWPLFIAYAEEVGYGNVDPPAGVSPSLSTFSVDRLSVNSGVSRHSRQRHAARANAGVMGRPTVSSLSPVFFPPPAQRDVFCSRRQPRRLPGRAATSIRPRTTARYKRSAAAGRERTPPRRSLRRALRPRSRPCP